MTKIRLTLDLSYALGGESLAQVVDQINATINYIHEENLLVPYDSSAILQEWEASLEMIKP